MFRNIRCLRSWYYLNILFLVHNTNSVKWFSYIYIAFLIHINTLEYIILALHYCITCHHQWPIILTLTRTILPKTMAQCRHWHKLVHIVFTFNGKHNYIIIMYLNSKYAVGVRHHSTEFLISGIGHGINDVNDCNSRFV